MINAVAIELEKPHFPCFAHVLNTFVEQIVENKFVTDIIDKVRAIYNLLSHVKQDDFSKKFRLIIRYLQTKCRLPAKLDGGLKSNNYNKSLPRKRFFLPFAINIIKANINI